MKWLKKRKTKHPCKKCKYNDPDICRMTPDSDLECQAFLKELEDLDILG